MSNNAAKPRFCCLTTLLYIFKRKENQDSLDLSNANESLSVLEDEYDTLSSEDDDEMEFARIIMKPIDEMERLKELMSNSLFFSNELFSLKKIQIIAYAFEKVELRKSNEILNFPQILQQMFMIESGSFIVKSKNGVERRLGKGDCFGEYSILYKTNNHQEITNDGECVIWTIDLNSFDSLIAPVISQFLHFSIEILKSTPFLKELSDLEQNLLLYGSHILELSSNEILYRQILARKQIIG